MAFIFHQWKYTIKRTDESRDCKMSPSEFSKHSLTISKLTVRLAWSAIGHQPQNQRQALFTETSFERNGLQRMFEQALSGWAILCVACQALLVVMLCTSANSNSLWFFSHQRFKTMVRSLRWLLNYNWLHSSYDGLILTFNWFSSAG